MSPTLKVAYTSDLHLDFDYPDFSMFKSDADYLFILGDTIESKWLEFAMNPNSSNHGQAQKLVQLFEQLNNDYKKVLIIAGNHEHYHANITETREIFESFIKLFKLSNIQFLEDDVIELEGKIIYGATMWTCMGGPHNYWYMKNGMNDFRLIRTTGYRKFRPEDAAIIHARCLARILEIKPDIILQHHAPSVKSVHPMYEGQVLNHAYYSDAYDKLLQNKIYWDLHIFHGHTHTPFEYAVGTAKVHCSPRGYGKENPSWKLKTIIL